ncbi:MAG TPA: S8 family serine peptidase, partial [Pyrinomonadaceae bacterium]|nr:S8 family serine peptidase [Pyrinomonadaceae bacterium]
MKRTPATPVLTWLTLAALVAPSGAAISFGRTAHAQSSGTSLTATENSQSVLSKYAVDLTQLAAQGKLEALPGFDAEVNRVIATLARSNTKVPVVLSESDVNRAAVARAVAMRIVAGDVPDTLRGKRALSLSLDSLAKGAKTSEQFEQRLQSVFAEVAEARNGIILFVDQLDQYAGARATATVSATVKSAISVNGVQMIAGASPEAFNSYIATDESVAKLFESISLDGVNSTVTASEIAKDKRKSPIDEEFEGEKISPDMRDFIRSAGSNGRVSAILQVSDVNSPEVRTLLARNGVLIGDTMATFGAMKVDLPAQVVETLMQNESMNFISPDVKIESFGHVTATTGADQIRNAPGLISSLLGTSAIDGTGITIAIIDSGMDLSHVAFQPSGRLKFKKDFTPENKPDKDFYGHGSHVAALAIGNYTNGTGTSFQGIAPNANFINLRVLDANGVGSTSTLLAALNWIL